MKEVIIWSILLSIEGGNVLLHAIGLYLLLSLYKGDRKCPQELYLINLSTSELVWNLVAVSRDIIKMICLLGDETELLDKVKWSLFIILTYTISS